ncbi:hypothetical protein NA57DRAFT_74171 [Rhizodiscina lignyota]|uniref:DUF6594 domain-containing protein n=1 Tax=Rhizodiscina lignyota TaxID=1504668 RepID=A0A9P4IF21_9PEZI|nr:hypothetical protein NA57DRAFT_74171 [Rhizodiscina lignyota]
MPKPKHRTGTKDVQHHQRASNELGTQRRDNPPRGSDASGVDPQPPQTPWPQPPQPPPKRSDVSEYGNQGHSIMSSQSNQAYYEQSSTASFETSEGVNYESDPINVTQTLDSNQAQSDNTTWAGGQQQQSAYPAHSGYRATELLHIYTDPNGQQWYHVLDSATVVDYPNGYPKLSAFINSDDSFRVYRRFGTLRVRLILHCQAELNALEKKLNEIDKEDAKDEKTAFRIQSISYDKDDETSTVRERLINEIGQKLKEYDDLLEEESKSLSMLRPTKRNHRSVFNFAYNKRFLVYDETEFLNHEDDFVTTAQDQDSHLHVAIEKLIQIFGRPWLHHIFSTNAQRASRGDEQINLYSAKRISFVVQILVSTLLIAALMAPICLLFEVDTTNKAKMVIVFAFLILFPPLMKVLTRAKNHELFAITAGYCAVLVVFLGNFSK